MTYIHTDHLGSVSATSTAAGTIGPAQDFDPWGAPRSGSITATSRTYTGQIKDAGTGLLYYNARYYDPALARFVSADSIVPNTSHRSLTVDFHEPGFSSALASENAQGFWFQMSRRERQQATPPWGPSDPQALNRYSYVNNNPLRYTDPSGHESEGYAVTKDNAYSVLLQLQQFLYLHGVDVDVAASVRAGSDSSVIGAQLEEVAKQARDELGVELWAWVKTLIEALTDMIHGEDWAYTQIVIYKESYSKGDFTYAQLVFIGVKGNQVSTFSSGWQVGGGILDNPRPCVLCTPSHLDELNEMFLAIKRGINVQ